ncbi:MAG: DUF692 domain-containing protein [Thiohalomonadales bacterium]
MTACPQQSKDRPMPELCGIGLRAPHYEDLLLQSPAVGFLEIHSENYFGAGGKPQVYLEKIAQDYPISFHGVGLSLGSTDELSISHLQRLKELADIYQPLLISEHLSWGSIDGSFLNDLLPLPYTDEALTLMCRHVEIMQDYLGRQCLIENISSYLRFNESTMSEQSFIVELARSTGCGILLDINNIYVSSINHHFDAKQFIAEIPATLVKEFHLAGHVCNTFKDGKILIDSHNRPVCEEVWQLYAYALEHIGGRPCLVEWDSDLPSLPTLVAEAHHADQINQRIIYGGPNAESSPIAANLR